MQSVLESWQESRIVQVDFSVAIDGVNQQGILKNQCSVTIGGSVLSMLTQFSNLSQYVMMDTCQSELVNITSRVSRRSVLGLLIG